VGAEITLIRVNTDQTVVDTGANVDEHARLLLMMITSGALALEATLSVVTRTMITIAVIGAPETLVQINARDFNDIAGQDV